MPAPGAGALPRSGPARWAGGEEQAASLLVEAIEAAVGVECFVGIADGPLASTEAARAGRIIPSDDTLSFLGPLGLSSALGCVPTSMDERMRATIQLLAGLGITTCSDLRGLGRGPVCERFGDVGQRLWTLASGGDVVVPLGVRAHSDLSVERDIDSGGERIETMTIPVTRAADELSGRLFRAGLVSHTLRIDVTDGGGSSRTRTWSGCDLSVSADIALRVRWTLTGWMSATQGPSGEVRSIRLTACDPHPGDSASALWGRGHREADVSRSAVRIQGLAGPDALLMPRVQGGYDPRSRVVMAPWGAGEALRSRSGAWEGAVSKPPATLFEEPVPVRLTASIGAGSDVCVDQRGALTAPPRIYALDAPLIANRIGATPSRASWGPRGYAASPAPGPSPGAGGRVSGPAPTCAPRSRTGEWSCSCGVGVSGWWRGLTSDGAAPESVP